MKELLIFSGNHTYENNFDLVINEILKHKPKYVLFTCLMEYEPPANISSESYSKLNEICIENNVVFYFAFSTKDKTYHAKLKELHYSSFKLLYWPTYLLHHTLDTFPNIDINEYNVVNKFDKLYLNFNYKTHYHRCLMVDKLCENNLFEYGKISWNLMTNTDHNSIVDYKFKCWEEKIMKADNYINCEITDDLLETKTFMSLTSESTDNCVFVSEKTFRSLLISQIFYAIGSKTQNIVLEDYGFLLYDELFDYRYDKMDKIEDRVDGVIYNLKKIKDLDYYELYETVKHKIEHNKKRALEIINDDPYIPVTLIELYKNYREEFYNYIYFPDFFHDVLSKKI